MVWVVSIEGQDDSRQFCKSARAAMKYMFLLKSRTGLYISKEGLQLLSAEIARQKALANESSDNARIGNAECSGAKTKVKNPEAVAKIQEHAEAIAEAYDVNRILAQPKEEKEAVAEEVKACASESNSNARIDNAESSQGSAITKPTPKKRGRKPKAAKAA